MTQIGQALRRQEGSTGSTKWPAIRGQEGSRFISQRNKKCSITLCGFYSLIVRHEIDFEMAWY
jgi:hypothetical protein